MKYSPSSLAKTLAILTTAAIVTWGSLSKAFGQAQDSAAPKTEADTNSTVPFLKEILRQQQRPKKTLKGRESSLLVGTQTIAALQKKMMDLYSKKDDGPREIDFLNILVLQHYVDRLNGGTMKPLRIDSYEINAVDSAGSLPPHFNVVAHPDTLLPSERCALGNDKRIAQALDWAHLCAVESVGVSSRSVDAKTLEFQLIKKMEADDNPYLGLTLAEVIEKQNEMKTTAAVVLPSVFDAMNALIRPTPRPAPGFRK